MGETNLFKIRIVLEDMKKLDMNRIVLLLFILAGICMRSQEKEIIWEENFDGNTLNEEFWKIETGDGCPELCGWGNNEEQSYTPDNIRLKDGYLHISAVKEQNDYTSGRITTKGKKNFKYGTYEVRLKLPRGKGLWPAVWMLGSNMDEVGWPMCGEIDMMEYVGREPNKFFTTLHTQDSHGNSKNTRKDLIPGLDEGFHVFKTEWNEQRISFYVDGEHFYTFNPKERTKEVWPFDQPFYLIVNLAIGGNFGGSEIDDKQLPQDLVVDYIRIYQ